MNVPNHVAIILDGNGRWAKAKGLPRTAGHVQGAKAVEQICEDAYNMGIHYLTVYAFSTENWSRPDSEVATLMNLLRNYMKNSIKRAQKNNMCVRVLGDKSALAPDLRASIEELEQATKNNTGLHFQIAINYGGRDELRRAIAGLADKVASGTLNPDEIDDAKIAAELDTAGLPDPDLLISSEYQIFCYGRLLMRNFILRPYRGLTLTKTSLPRRWRHIRAETGDMGS